MARSGQSSTRQAVPGRDPVADALAKVEQAVPRVAALGAWPAWIGPESLTDRIPVADEEASGFDAGIACALDLIPRDKQQLAAKLHAAYTEEAVEQVRAEIVELDPDSETCWWLAGCAVCIEGRVDRDTFLDQVKQFVRLAGDRKLRLAEAKRTLDEMLSTFTVSEQGPLAGVPYGEVDGCQQGAYLAGYDLAAMKAEFTDEPALYFLGTFRETLGLDMFLWSGEIDSQGRARSGPVHGSRQFVKCTSFDELARAAAVARRTLGVS